MPGNFFEFGEDPVVAYAPVARDQRDAYFIFGHGSDVHLAVFAPMYLHAVGPGRHTEVPAKTEALRPRAVGIETGPLTDRGVLAVGADDPAAAERTSVDGDLAAI